MYPAFYISERTRIQWVFGYCFSLVKQTTALGLHIPRLASYSGPSTCINTSGKNRKSGVWTHIVKIKEERRGRKRIFLWRFAGQQYSALAKSCWGRSRGWNSSENCRSGLRCINRALGEKEKKLEQNSFVWPELRWILWKFWGLISSWCPT